MAVLKGSADTCVYKQDDNNYSIRSYGVLSSVTFPGSRALETVRVSHHEQAQFVYVHSSTYDRLVSEAERALDPIHRFAFLKNGRILVRVPDNDKGVSLLTSGGIRLTPMQNDLLQDVCTLMIGRMNGLSDWDTLQRRVRSKMGLSPKCSKEGDSRQQFLEATCVRMLDLLAHGVLSAQAFEYNLTNIVLNESPETFSAVQKRLKDRLKFWDKVLGLSPELEDPCQFDSGVVSLQRTKKENFAKLKQPDARILKARENRIDETTGIAQSQRYSYGASVEAIQHIARNSSYPVDGLHVVEAAERRRKDKATEYRQTKWTHLIQVDFVECSELDGHRELSEALKNNPYHFTIEVRFKTKEATGKLQLPHFCVSLHSGNKNVFYLTSFERRDLENELDNLDSLRKSLEGGRRVGASKSYLSEVKHKIGDILERIPERTILLSSQRGADILLVRLGCEITILTPREIGLFKDSSGNYWVHGILTPPEGRSIGLKTFEPEDRPHSHKKIIEHKDSRIKAILLDYFWSEGTHAPFVPVGFDLSPPNSKDFDSIVS